MIEKIIDQIYVLLQFLRFFVVLEPYQGGVIVTMGTRRRVVGPGFHFVWPFHIDSINTTNVVRETITIGPQFLTTKDDIAVAITSVVTFSVQDVEVFLLEVEGANQAVSDSTLATVSSCVMKHPYEKLRSGNLSSYLTRRSKASAQTYGVSIESHRIKDFTRVRPIAMIGSNPEKVG